MDAVRWVDQLLADAVQRQASDIHIESLSVGGRIRWRIDGILFDGGSLEPAWVTPIITRLKVMGQLDISQRRLPQDGRCTFSIKDHEISLRIATLPIAEGERVALRILPVQSANLTLSGLGFQLEQERDLQKWLAQNSGLLVVTGPTGTGKTTTLYALLQKLKGEDRNLMTLEDPIEQLLPGVNQVQVHRKAGLTFAVGLRAILRQDPDVVMVGEIRDLETADIAIRASLTGHLVLTSMHTVDAVSAVTRLLDMGVESYRVTAALRGVVAQRLFRRICFHCKGKRCTVCHFSGYRGRSGVFEMLSMEDSELHKKIHGGVSLSMLRHYVQSKGTMIRLAEALHRHQQKGVTDKQEFMRVVNTFGSSFC